ncbi:TPA: hypothetical protein HA249_06420 [Candidatus Woesearchaeota archaeon]|nr:hypothetical protein [Candidatus Woesearchaeota archaeon]
MDFSTKLKKEMVNLLEEIKDVFLLKQKGTEWFAFDTFPDDKTTNYDYAIGMVAARDREIILRKLAELGVLELKQDKREPRSEIHETNFQLRLNKSKFTQLYEEFKKVAITNAASNKGILLYLDREGGFWLDPKEEFCYLMDRDSERLKILTYLVDNEGYRLTDEVAEYIGGKNKQNVRSEIGKIKRNIKTFLQLNDVIQSKPSSGYRINPVYKVIKVGF